MVYGIFCCRKSNNKLDPSNWVPTKKDNRKKFTTSVNAGEFIIIGKGHIFGGCITIYCL